MCVLYGMLCMYVCSDLGLFYSPIMYVWPTRVKKSSGVLFVSFRFVRSLLRHLLFIHWLSFSCFLSPGIPLPPLTTQDFPSLFISAGTAIAWGKKKTVSREYSEFPRTLQYESTHDRIRRL